MLMLMFSFSLSFLRDPFHLTDIPYMLLHNNLQLFVVFSLRDYVDYIQKIQIKFCVWNYIS